MKTKIKRHSRSVISVILAVCMLISCMTAAMIATDAANVDSETVGANADSEAVGTQIGNQHLYIDLTAKQATYSGVNTYYSNTERYDDGKHIGWYTGNYTDLGGYVYDVDIIAANSANQYAEGFKVAWDGGEKFIAYESGKNCIVVDSSGNLSWISYTPGYYVHYGSGTDKSNWTNHISIDSTGFDVQLNSGEYSGAINHSATGVCSSNAGVETNFSVSATPSTVTPPWDGYVPQYNSNVAGGCNGFKLRLTQQATVHFAYDGTTKVMTTSTDPVIQSVKVSGTVNGNTGDFDMTQDGNTNKYYYDVTSGTTQTFNFKYNSGTFGAWKGHDDIPYPIVDNNHTTENGGYGTQDNDTHHESFTFTRSGSQRIWFNIDSKKAWVETTAVIESTLSIANNIADATVRATYNGTTIDEGGYINNVPAGATVTISVTPEIGQKCTAVTATPAGATITGSGRTFTLTMPAENTTITGVSLDVAQMKKVYFNNYYTRYPMVTAYAWYGTANQSRIDGEPLGSWSGQTMTRIPNTNTWEIEVPEDCPYIIFSGEDYHTISDANVDGKPYYHITIPWDDQDKPNPMYTAGKDKTDPTDGGRWGNYVARDNETTVSDGQTLSSNTNLFHGISATMYDYYVDSEHTNGWLHISDPEYSKSGAAFTANPYTIFNDALDGYAKEFSVDKQLYFGDFYSAADDGNTAITKVVHGDRAGQIYWGWFKLINNSQVLNDTEKRNAVTGITGKTLADSDIHYYDSSAANENGARMAMFDEDFLSGQNNQGTKLAQILRVSSFPIRTTSRDTYTHVYFDASGIKNWYENDNYSIYAYFWNGSVSTKVTGTKTGDVFAFEIPEGYDSANVLFYRAKTLNGSWTNQTANLNVPKNGDSNVKFTSTGNGGTNGKDIYGSWGTYNDAAKNEHVYYEYDSTGGTDNAYIQNISSNGKTAVINYYSASDNQKVYAAKANSGTADLGAAGFFPFDNNDTINQVGKTAHDLGFGMKLEIPFTLEANGQFEDGTHQVFDFSGDDDLWVFVDGKLVLDLGGDHNATTGKIDFADKTASATHSQALDNSVVRNGSFEIDNSNPNTVHTMTLYYMERGMWDSNLKFGFSFHAIPNQLKTEKKVRTANINKGFYNDNKQTGAASNKSDSLSTADTFIGKFEETYQSEEFLITHEYQTTGMADYAPVAGKQYTIGSSATKTVGANGQYTLKNDEIAYFLSMFDHGDMIRLQETANTSNLYNYDMSAAVYDDANNETLVTSTNNAGTPFTFEFVPTSAQTIETLNLRARFTNQMKSHNLSVSKTATGGSDNDEFTFRIKFKFGDYDYIAYPITGSKTGTGIDTKENVTVNGDGTFTLKNGQTVLFEKIPENAKIQIEEININTTYSYNGFTVTGANKTNITDGVQFTMGTTDITANASNSKFSGFTVSKELKYSPSNGVFVDYPDSTTAFNIKIESSSDGTNWAALGSKAFTSSDSSRTGTLATDANGLTTIKRGEKLSFADITTNTYIRVTEDTEDSTQAGNYLDHMPLDYQYAGMAASTGVTTTTHGSAGGWQGISFQVSSARVDVTITNMKPRYEYLANYTFASRKKNVTKTTDESIWGDLSYKAQDVFTAQDLYDYTEFAIQKDYQKADRKGIQFKNDDLKEEFFNKKTTPFDDNFRQTVSWKVKDAKVEYHFGNANESCQLVITPQAEYDDDLVLSVYFNLPCKMKPNTSMDKLIIDENSLENGVPKAKFDENGYPTPNNENIFTSLPKDEVHFADWYASNGVSVKNYSGTGTTPNFVTAPLVVYDVDSQDYKYFQYWSIKTMENDAQNSVEYARCYSNELNYVFFQDSNAYAMYGDTQATGYENARTAQGNQANLIFLENSRNQWNQTAANTPYAKKDWGDRVFSDFVLDFHYVTKDNQNLLLQTIPENERANYKAGLLIETVRDLDSTEVDKTKKKMLKTDKEIANGFRAVDNMAAQNAALIYLQGITPDTKYLNSEISVNKFDNKNELEYAYSFANISQSANSTYRTETTRKDKLYRAFAYLIHEGGGENGENVEIISAPIYFTIYDIASIVNEYDVKVTE